MLKNGKNIVNMISQVNHKDFFYRGVPIEIKSKINDYLDRCPYEIKNYVDFIVVIKWIEYFFISSFENKKHRSPNQYEINQSFEDYCLDNAPNILRVLDEILTKDLSRIYSPKTSSERLKLSFDDVMRFTKSLSIKRNYNKSHFKNRKYIKNILSEIEAIVKYFNSNNSFYVQDYLYPNTTPINKDYYWSKMVYGTSPYNLMRRTNSFMDPEVIVDLNICELVFSFDLKPSEDGTVYLHKRHLADRFKKLVHFDKENILSMMKTFHETNPFVISYDGFNIDEFDFAYSLSKKLNLKTHLKVLLNKNQEYLQELKEYFKDSKNCLSNFYNRVVFKIQRNEIFDLLKFVDVHRFRHLNSLHKIYKDLFENPWTLSYQNVIEMFDFFTLRDKYDIDNFQNFKNKYINDYDLKQILADHNFKSTRNFLIKQLTQCFEIKQSFKDEDGNFFYYIEIESYITSIVMSEPSEFVVPKDGWLILEQYFSKNSLKDFDNYDIDTNIIEDSIITITDCEIITEKLIQFLDAKYGSDNLVNTA